MNGDLCSQITPQHPVQALLGNKLRALTTCHHLEKPEFFPNENWAFLFGRNSALTWLFQAVSPSGSGSSFARAQAVTVLASKHAIVIGPTPPGTGVMLPATLAQLSN